MQGWILHAIIFPNTLRCADFNDGIAGSVVHVDPKLNTCLQFVILYHFEFVSLLFLQCFSCVLFLTNTELSINGEFLLRDTYWLCKWERFLFWFCWLLLNKVYLIRLVCLGQSFNPIGNKNDAIHNWRSFELRINLTNRVTSCSLISRLHVTIGHEPFGYFLNRHIPYFIIAWPWTFYCFTVISQLLGSQNNCFWVQKTTSSYRLRRLI